MNLIQEKYRLNAVERYKELELQQDKNLNDIVELASYIFQTPIALLTLLDKDVQWLVSKKGTEIEQMPRENSFCTYAIEQEMAMVVRDASEDIRFSDGPVVKPPINIKFYAGVPLRSYDGYNVGTLCVLDHKPRNATPEQLNCLQALTNQVANLLELKVTFRVLSESVDELTKQNTLLQKIAQVQSHELRAPVVSIMGLMSLIKYEDYQPNKEYLLMMEECVDELDKKVQAIVKLASNNNDGFNEIKFPVTFLNAR